MLLNRDVVFTLALCDLKGQGAIMEVMDGGEEKSLSTIRLCGMRVPLSKTLDLS